MNKRTYEQSIVTNWITELNREIMDKKILGKIKLKNGDKIEIVHFIGGG